MKLWNQKSLAVLLSILFASCGGGSGTATSSSSTGTSTSSTSQSENTVSAVASLMSGFSGGGASSQNLQTKFTINSTGADICDADNMANGPTGVIMSTRGGVSSHPYGSVTDPMTISSESDYCEDSSGVANSGTGPDGQGKFASFIFLGDPEGSCDDGSSFSFTKGSGIVRNTQEYYPEIFGRFELDGSQIVNCTLRISEDGIVDIAHSSCSDDDGVLLSLDTTVSCSIDANLPEIEDPSFYKGHYGLGESAERNLNYECVNYQGFEQDDDHISQLVNDCSALTDVGFNIEFLSIGAYATDTSANGDLSSWEIQLSGTSEEELRQSVQLLHAAGLQVVLAVDILYFEDPEQPDDDVDFPQPLIDNAAFQADLTAFILEQAAFAESVGADIFIPLSESDRVFALASIDDDEYLAGIIDDVAAAFTNKLAYVWSYDITRYTAANMAAFDLLGFNRSPQGHDHMDENCSGSGASSNCLLEVLAANLASQQAIVSEVNSSHGGSMVHFIDSLGVWGAAAETEPSGLPGEVDWMEDAVVAEMYESAFALVGTYGASGFVAWEGADSEFVFPGQALTLEALTQGFAGF